MLAAVWTLATALASFAVGHELQRRFLKRDAHLLERLAAALLGAAALWIASVWLLGLTHLLVRPAMVARTAVFVVAAVALRLTNRRSSLAPRASTHDSGLRTQHYALIALLPVIMWLAFVLWRATITPPLSHDALAYHLPRAVLFTRMERYAPIDLPVDRRLRLLPPNYELLLADSILLDEGDGYTEWLSTCFYVAFVIASGALMQRWWRGRLVPVLAGMVLIAGAPILLLQSGADKNDIMVAFFMTAAMLWCGRWLRDGELQSLALTMIALVAATGTKPQGVMLAASLAPIVVWGALRHRAQLRITPRLIAGAAALTIAAVLLLGGWHYLTPQANQERGKFVAYDDWQNLWQAPWVLLTAPFSPWPDDLYVPWESETWFWKKYEIYFSHLGMPFALCAVLAPFAIARFRRDARHAADERMALAAAALATLFMLFPVRDVPMPHGIYVTALPRYVLFILPIVFGWSLVPALERIERDSPLYAMAALFLAAGWFSHDAMTYAREDRFVPPGYVKWAERHPGTRVVPFNPTSAAQLADRNIPENETIAVDAGYGTWIHPLFGPHLRRPVEFIPRGDGPPVIDAKTKWVVVDRNWAIVWQHPLFRDTSLWRKYIAKGKPTAEDTRTVRYLLHDPRFELVYYRPSGNQAVFRRR